MSPVPDDTSFKPLPPEDNRVDSLYQEHRKVLMMHLLAMVGDRHIAEELLHDVFLRLSRMPTLEGIKQPRSFLMKIASNLALDYLRHQKIRAENNPDAYVPETAGPESEQLDELLKERRVSQLKAAIRELPPRTREALMLAKFREMTLKEVAREMEISQTMVEKHLKTAIEKCRITLKSSKH